MIDRRSFLAAGLAAAAHSQTPERPFRIGFTPFPVRLDTEGFLQTYRFIPSHSDVSGLFLQDGVPWEEALSGRGMRAYPRTFVEFIRFHRALMELNMPRHARYLAVAPLSLAFDGIQPLWAETANMPLPYPWNTYDFDHRLVKEALLNHMREMIGYFEPVYFSLGVESNILLARAPQHWQTYLDLHRFLYTSLKREFPRLTILFSIQYEHFIGAHAESAELARSGAELRELRPLMEMTDALAVSSYPYLVKDLVAGADYFDPAINFAAGFNKPVAIDQTGMTTRDLTLGGVLITGNERSQDSFLGNLLNLAAAKKFLFVINFVPIDFGDNHGTDDIARAWSFTGLATEDGRPKPSLATWDRFVAMQYKP
ncbi:MAG: hypothetical protein FJW39_12530 [Acidobacteria bacterium]|nr:hypothetical protein [Acidobacteriota bacterium]